MEPRQVDGNAWSLGLWMVDWADQLGSNVEWGKQTCYEHDAEAQPETMNCWDREMKSEGQSTVQRSVG